MWVRVWVSCRPTGLCTYMYTCSFACVESYCINKVKKQDALCKKLNKETYRKYAWNCEYFMVSQIWGGERINLII